jgi:glycosyltransferase involved in cell wall biosynthesis
MTGTSLDQIRGMRIAHLIESDGPGGAERLVAGLATELQAAGCDNLVIMLAGGEGWLSNELAGTGVTLAQLELREAGFRTWVRLLAETLRRYRPAVAHSHEFMMAVHGALGARRARVPHLITMHGGRYYAERLRRRAALRGAATLSGALVSVSEAVGQHLSRDLWLRRSRILSVPNGVRWVPAQRSSLRQELRLAPTDRLLLAVGNLYPVKGHSHLIDALALLADSHASVHLAIAGRGNLAEALQVRARALGLADRVHLLGLRSDIPSLLAGADIFVLPSLAEGLPLALLEAMFAGRPIVASDVGEVRVVLNGGEAGLLVQPGNAAELARALGSLLADPNEGGRLGQRAALRAASEYASSRMVERYARLYFELSQKNRASVANGRPR